MRHRVMQHWVRDGSWELAIGVAFTVGAAIALLGGWLTEWSDVLWETQFTGWLILAGFMNSRRQRKEIQSGGYMEPTIDPKVVGLMIAAGMIVVLFGADVIVPEEFRGDATDWAMVIGFGYLGLGFLTRLRRYFLLGALALAAGVWVALNGWADALVGWAGWGLIMGIAEVPIGLLAWRRGRHVRMKGAEDALV